MSSPHPNNPNEEYYYNQQQHQHDQSPPAQLNVPKVRPHATNAAPATPRMLRHVSGSNATNISDEYTINPDFMTSQRTPSKKLPISANAVHQRQTSAHTQTSTDRTGLLPGMDFNGHNSPRESRRSSNQPSNQSSSQPQNQYMYQDMPPPSRHAQPSTPPIADRSPAPAPVAAPIRAPEPLPELNPAQIPPAPAPAPSQQQQQQQQQQQFHRKAIGDWEFTKTIGAGSMGKVKLAKHRVTQEICAIKVVTRAAKVWQRQHMNDPPTSDPHLLTQRKKEYEKEVARDKRTIREAALGKILYHPFICRLYEMYSMSNHYYMLFEYVSGGQMLDYIVAHGSLKESQARKFCRGIGSALEYCHSNNIVHRDLKIENIMINNAGEIKIIDFGLSNLYTHDHLLKTYCGSLYFAAPELLSAHPYRGPEVDIWSFGVVLFVLVCGRVPFDDKSVSNLHEKIKKGHIDYPEHLSPDCISLMKRMLVVDVTKRASIQDVLNHRWINKGYSGPVSNYIPIRTPLTMPFSRSVITEIVNLNLASSEEQVANDLTEIVHSEYYLRCSENWRLKTSGLKYDPTLLDPTRGYHPLVSIYFLVDEMLERKRAKFERNAIPEAKQIGNTSNVNPLYTTPHVQQNPVFNAASQHPNMAHEPQNRIVTQPVPQQYQHGGFQETSNREVFPGPPKLNIEVPTAPYSLPFPEAAHTSPRNDVSNRSFNKMTGTNAAKQLSPPPLQQQSPVEENGVNALLRKLSTKKQP